MNRRREDIFSCVLSGPSAPGELSNFGGEHVFFGGKWSLLQGFVQRPDDLDEVVAPRERQMSQLSGYSCRDRERQVPPSGRDLRGKVMVRFGRRIFGGTSRV